MAFLNTFSWKKIFLVWFKFHVSCIKTLDCKKQYMDISQWMIRFGLGTVKSRSSFIHSPYPNESGLWQLQKLLRQTEMNWSDMITAAMIQTSQKESIRHSTSPRIIPMVRILLCVVSIWYWLILLMSFRVTSLVLGQSYDCPSASEVTLKDMGK